MMINPANITAPSRVPKTLSIKYPPIMGKITFGHEYHAYKLANWVVDISIASLIWCCIIGNNSNHSIRGDCSFIDPIDKCYGISLKWSMTTCKAPGLSMQKYAPKPNKLIRDKAINRWHKASGSQSHETPQPRVSELSINLSVSRWDSSSENSLIQKICNALCLNI